MHPNDDEHAERLAATVLRQGELRLQDQLARAIASDQRATTLAALFTAAAMAAFGYAVGIIDRPTPNYPIGIAGLCTGGVLLISVLLCVVAVWPVPFAGVGAEPRKWWNDAVESRSLADCLKKESENYQKRITHNRSAHASATRFLGAGIVVGCSAPAAGLAAWVLVSALV